MNRPHDQSQSRTGGANWIASLCKSSSAHDGRAGDCSRRDGVTDSCSLLHRGGRSGGRELPRGFCFSRHDRARRPDPRTTSAGALAEMPPAKSVLHDWAWRERAARAPGGLTLFAPCQTLAPAERFERFADAGGMGAVGVAVWIEVSDRESEEVGRGDERSHEREEFVSVEPELLWVADGGAARPRRGRRDRDAARPGAPQAGRRRRYRRGRRRLGRRGRQSETLLPHCPGISSVARPHEKIPRCGEPP